MNDPGNASNFTETDWVAFEYLTGELSANAVAQFEARLQDDQSARESLARVVQITQAVAIIESTVDKATERVASPSRQASSVWAAPAVWLSAVALACVVFVLCWNPGTPLPTLNSGHQPVATNDRGTLDSGELAAHWVDNGLWDDAGLWGENGEFLVTAEIVGDGEGVELAGDEPSSQSFGASDGEVNVEPLRAPSWMVVALGGSLHAEPQE